MPYSYFQLVRFVSFAGFGYLAFESNKRKDEKMMFVFIALALLFQPFFKIALGRIFWNIVDVIVAVFLIFSVFKHQRKLENENKY